MSEELPQELMLLTRAHCELAEARTVKDLKTIRDKAEAARVYAKSALLGLEVQIYAAELKLECERRAGQILSEVQFAEGGRPGKENRSHVATGLEDLGINKSQSSRWQQEAQVSEEDFQRYLSEARAAHKEPTSQGLLRLAGRLSSHGAHWHGKRRIAKTGSRKRGKVVDSPSGRFPRPFATTDEEDCLIGDVINHHKQLVGLLAEFCGDAPVIRPLAEQRRYVARLITEMGEFLVRLQSLREPSGSMRGSRISK